MVDAKAAMLDLIGHVREKRAPPVVSATPYTRFTAISQLTILKGGIYRAMQACPKGHYFTFYIAAKDAKNALADAIKRLKARQ